LLIAGFGMLQTAAQPLPNGSVGGFEDDGNMVEEPAVTGTMDWDNATGVLTQVTDDTIDSGYKGSSKENAPETFVCNTGGADPGKNNILRAYVNTRITGPPDVNPTTAFLDLGFVRESGTGDAHVNFEFNRNNITNPCPFTGRTTGDLLITFDFPGGSGVANITAFQWDAALDSGKGNWAGFTLPAGSAAGGTNAEPITDVFTNDPIGVREFGEATVDLVAFDEATGGGLLACPGFGHVNIRSRSSGESFNSALQDRLPQTTIDVSTCGSVQLQKNDDADNPLPGAQFGLFASDDPNATGTAVYTCTSNAQGICSFPMVAPDDYFLHEISAPTGYDPDPEIRPVTVGFREDVDLTGAPFTDPRQTGFVHIDKVLHDLDGKTVDPSDPSVLDGTTFQLYQDTNNNGSMQAGEESTLWPSGDPATCVIENGDAACDIGPVATGDYRVAETVAPPNSNSAGDVNVTVTQGNVAEAAVVDYVNILSAINISLDKSAGATANVGETVVYSFDVTTIGPRLHDITLEEQTTLCASAPTGPGASDIGSDGYLTVGETWHYTCSHVVTMQDTDPLLNTAKVTGTDDYGRDTSSTDHASIDILYPDVTVAKTAVDPSISFGTNAAFTIVASVGGDDGAIARGVQVTDTLPSGLTWTDDSASCTVTNGTDLSCNFGDMAKGTTATVTVTAPTTEQNCGDIVNPKATVSATNEKPADQENNDSSSATIHVSCDRVDVTKTGPDTASVGDTITYVVSVKNTGNNDLVTVVFSDPVCDANTVVLVDDGNGDTTLAVDETWVYNCTHVVTATDPDPLPNTATVTGTDIEGETASDSDSHSVDILPVAVAPEDVAPAKLARTGFLVGKWVTVAIVLLGMGLLFELLSRPVLVVASIGSGRRRKPTPARKSKWLLFGQVTMVATWLTARSLRKR
jgi:uncharacterized repeat protein (TIGR01451 family)